MGDSVLEIERAAFDAWPADEVVDQGGWRLRHNDGVTNRANSVWPNELDGSADLAARIAAVERFYAARNRPAVYQITSAARPAALDAELATRGYERVLPVEVRVRRADQIDVLATPAGVTVEHAGRPDGDWFDLSGRRGRFDGAAIPVYRRLLGRLVGRATFVLVRVGGEPAATGLAVESGDLVGIFAMRTLAEHRRQGLGRLVLGGIAAWRPQARLYLQVEADNAPAVALYHRCGFRIAYRYHYRRQLPAPIPAV